MALLVQLCGVATVCFLTLIMGITYTWPSSTMELFKSNETVLSHPMQPYEVALLGSMSSIGGVVGTPLAGYLLDKVGRKYSSIIFGIPFLIGWSLVAAFNQVEVILTSQLFLGLGGGSFVVSPVFSSEICQDSIRGTVTAGSMIFFCIGILLSYTLGGFMSYYVMIYILVTMSALYIFFVSLLKDSPLYLLSIGKENEAANSIAFYRSVRPDSKEVLEELANIKRLINLENSESPEEEKLKPETDPKESVPKEKMSPIKCLWKSQPARRAFVICLTMVTLSIFMGLVVVQVYAEPLFKEAVPNMSPTLCSIIFAVVTMIATIFAGIIVDKAGRKILMLISSGGCAVMTLLLGAQLQFQWGPHIFTALLIYVFCFIYSIGAGVVPYIVVYEVFLPELKSFCSMLVLEWLWLCNFFILLVFNPLVDSLGLGPIFYIFSGICVLTALFCYFFQPETKGLPVDVIQTLFTKKTKKNYKV